MNVFKSVSSHVDEIRDSRSRVSAINSLDAITELVEGHKSLSSVAKKVRKLSEQLEHKEVSRKKLLKALSTQVLPKVKMVSESSDVLPKNVSAVMSRVLLMSREAVRSKQRTVEIGRDSLYLTPSEISKSKLDGGKYLRNEEDIKLFRGAMLAPCVHAKLGATIIASIAMLKGDTRQLALDFFKDTVTDKQGKPSVLLDHAVKKAYQVLLDEPNITWPQLLRSSAIQADAYALPFLANGSKTNRINVEPSYKTYEQVARASARLAYSAKHLARTVRTNPALKSLSSTYAVYSNVYRVPVEVALSEVNLLLNENKATVDQKNIRDVLRDKYERKLPTSFTPASAFTIRHLPIETRFRTFELNDPKKLDKFGIKAVEMKTGATKKDATLVLEEQAVLFIDRSLIKESVLSELEEVASDAMEKVEQRLKETRSAVNAMRRNFKSLEARRPEASASEARKIDAELKDMRNQLAELESSLETVKKNRNTKKKQLDDRLKFYRNNQDQVLQLGLDLVLEVINSRTSNEFTPVSKSYPNNPNAKDSSMIWLMPTALSSAIQGAFGTLSVDNWNLPWSAQAKAKALSN